jgi:hypothetical protein
MYHVSGMFGMDSRAGGNDDGGLNNHGVIPAQAGIHANTGNTLL